MTNCVVTWPWVKKAFTLLGFSAKRSCLAGLARTAALHKFQFIMFQNVYIFNSAYLVSILVDSPFTEFPTQCLIDSYMKELCNMHFIEVSAIIWSAMYIYVCIYFLEFKQFLKITEVL